MRSIVFVFGRVKVKVMVLWIQILRIRVRIGILRVRDTVPHRTTLDIMVPV